MSLPIFPNLSTMAWNSTKKMKFKTIIQESGSGKKKTRSLWSAPEWTIKCSYTCLEQSREKQDLEEIYGFFGQVKGAGEPFLWWDPEDNTETNVQLGIGDGVKTQFQLLRNYAGKFLEIVLDPRIVSEVRAGSNPVAFTLGTDGVININPAPAPGLTITADFTYYWRVMFADDSLEAENFWYNLYKLKSIEVVSVK